MIAKRTGSAAGAMLLTTSTLSVVGLFQLPACKVGLLVNFYSMALAALTILLEADIWQIATIREIILFQARCLGAPQGLGLLHLVQGTLAFAQGSVIFTLGGLVALAASALDFAVWYIRSRSMATADSSGLIVGQLDPSPTEVGNAEIMMQNC